jgi:hypothetical protein
MPVVTNDPEVPVAEAGKDGEAASILRRSTTPGPAGWAGSASACRRGTAPAAGRECTVEPTLTRCDQEGRIRAEAADHGPVPAAFCAATRNR